MNKIVNYKEFDLENLENENRKQKFEIRVRNN